VSIVYFQNPFTVTHWIGTILVFFGTLLFAEVLPKFSKTVPVAREKKSE
jgi:solute carrier family 35 (UDP-xylose/UDP-N-acetylglucosamine transporter), member B4